MFCLNYFSFLLISKKLFKMQRKLSSQPNLKTLIEKYGNEIIFNNIIESSGFRPVPKNNRYLIKKKAEYESKITEKLRSIQPLPVTLKYCTELTTKEKETIPKLITEKEPVAEFKAHFPYKVNTEVQKSVEESHTKDISIKDEITHRKELLKKNMKNWMANYDNYEYDLVDGMKHVEDIVDGCEINYGTPDIDSIISDYPCGGCGAYLHCKDQSIPGYIPSEIFKNCFNPNGSNLGATLCQRCYFLKEYNVALQVRVSSDDYPEILKPISQQLALAILIVDLTDLPCSIWPGMADILGSKIPIIAVGNKIDLLPKDNRKFLDRIKANLLAHLKIYGFATANIKRVELVSAKTGYGIENLISALRRIWRHRGNVYLLGTTNVGKSSLFNALLLSDLCKIQAADSIQRATTSPWPGTTLNLLKFPMTRFSDERKHLRYEKLQILQQIEKRQKDIKSEMSHYTTDSERATLTGYIEKSFGLNRKEYNINNNRNNVSGDVFLMDTNKSTLSGGINLGIDETDENFAMGRWCFDTPGVVHPDQILHVLTADELIKVLPKSIIRPETFCVRPGTTLFIAGLARLDYVKGPRSIRLTVFRSNELPITICEIDKANDVYHNLIGSELFQVPINKGNRLKKWPGLELAKKFTVNGKSKKESTVDVVLSNAGWIAINCEYEDHEFQAWTPEKRGVHIRDCLLPGAVLLRGDRIRNSVAYQKHKFLL